MKKIIFSLITLLILQSCVQDEENVFGIPAAERMQQSVAEYSALLASSENGWFADYYPEKAHSIGGYAMFLKFNANGTVVVSCETSTNLPAGEADTSQYKVFAEQGAVLSFVTYNKVMHYFSEPSSADIDGRAGDYEFVIMKVVSQNEVHLKGKKQNNKLVLRRNVDNLVPKEHFDNIVTFSDEDASTFASFYYMIGSDTLGTLATTSGRTFSLKYKVGHITGKGTTVVDTTVTISYTFTPDGFRLYEPLSLDNIITEKYRDVVVDYFKWNSEKGGYESTNSSTNVVLKGYYPADFQLAYADILGTWELKYTTTTTETPPTTGYRTGEVTIVTKKKNSTFNMLSDDLFSFPEGVGIELTYDAQKGTISILAQALPTDFIVMSGANQRTVRLYNILKSGSTGTGATPISSKYGVIGKWNGNAGGTTVLTFGDNNRGGTAIGMRLRLYTLEGASASADYSANIAGAIFAHITLTKQ